jgi:hypothetical protein
LRIAGRGGMIGRMSDPIEPDDMEGMPDDPAG